jgi:hypothetical protein
MHQVKCVKSRKHKQNIELIKQLVKSIKRFVEVIIISLKMTEQEKDQFIKLSFVEKIEFIE